MLRFLQQFNNIIIQHFGDKKFKQYQERDSKRIDSLKEEFENFIYVSCVNYSTVNSAIYINQSEDLVHIRDIIQFYERHKPKDVVYKYILSGELGRLYTIEIYEFKVYTGGKTVDNKEQILKRIENAEAELKQAKEALEKYNNTEWVPEIGEEYWCVNNMNKPDNFTYHFSCMADINRINNLNCFKTEEEAQQECEKIYVRRKLEQIARRLGVPSKEDWQNWRITKWYIGLNVEENKLSLNSNNNHKAASVTYCLSHEILKIAIKEIGEDRLIKYCKGV